MDHLKNLEQILENSDTEQNIINLINFCTSQSKSVIQDLLKCLTSVFTDLQRTSFNRLQCVRITKSLMSINKSSITLLVQSELVPAIEHYILSKQPSTGFSIWFTLLSSADNSEFKVFILLMQCIETWAKAYPADQNGNRSQFLSCFLNIKKKSIEFPPLFFLKPVDKDSAQISKKDLKRVKNLCGEFKKNLSYTNKDKCVHLRKILKSYDKHLKEAGNFESNKKVYSKLLLEINQLMTVFDKWKSSHYKKIPDDQKLKIFKVVEDPQPKIMPAKIEYDEDDWDSKQEESKIKVVGHKRSITGKNYSNFDKLAKYKEKINRYKETQRELYDQVDALRDCNSKIEEENKVLSNKNKELENSIADCQNRLRDANLLQNLCEAELKKKEKELRRVVREFREMKINFETLEKNNFLVQRENEKIKIKNKKLRFEKNFNRTLSGEFDKKVNKKTRKSADLLIEKSETLNLQFCHPIPIFDKHVESLVQSDSESGKASVNEYPGISPPNISANLSEKYFIRPMPSKSSRIQRRPWLYKS